MNKPESKETTKKIRQNIHNFLKEKGLLLKRKDYAEFRILLDEYCGLIRKTISKELMDKDIKLNQLKEYITKNEVRRKEIGCTCKCHLSPESKIERMDRIPESKEEESQNYMKECLEPEEDWKSKFVEKSQMLVSEGGFLVEKEKEVPAGYIRIGVLEIDGDKVLNFISSEKKKSELEGEKKMSRIFPEIESQAKEELKKDVLKYLNKKIKQFDGQEADDYSNGRILSYQSVRNFLNKTKHK